MHHVAGAGPQHGILARQKPQSSRKWCRDLAMIPADQKQPNTAFPKLTISYVTRRDTEQCLWVNSSIPWLQNFRNDKLLYSGWGKLRI